MDEIVCFLFFFYEMEHPPPNLTHTHPFLQTCSVFMISIISDCKNNIKYDFAVLKSYFIYNGEDIVPLLM